MDRLTQLQDTLDDVGLLAMSIDGTEANDMQLLTQMYASLNYIQQRHPYGEFPNQPSQAEPPAPRPNAPALTNGNGTDTIADAGTNGDAKAKVDQEKKDDDKKADEAPAHIPDEPDVFENTMRELARSLILQEQKAEILINSLPGIGNSEESQIARMAELERELRRVEAERARAEEERERMVDVLGETIVGIKRVR